MNKLSRSSLIFAGLLSLVSLGVNAQFIEGKDYAVISEAQPIKTGEKIEVREMFWYGCPHCYSLEPHVQRWKSNMPENAEFVAQPAIFSAGWEFHARAFYTFETLGIVDKVHGAFFDQIHRKKRNANSLSDLQDFLASYDMDPDDVKNAYNSFVVDSQLGNARINSMNYEIRGVPAVIIDGKYRTSTTMAGSEAGMFDIIEFLIEKSASER
ncbi:MAG: thiol:disulfide interchange protein DsbA/DsbL [Arenicellaceae bacterium]|nr:thiol:disulfide interchange protein DsbA/DsbL [Arenicellaceae bacterium]